MSVLYVLLQVQIRTETFSLSLKQNANKLFSFIFTSKIFWLIKADPRVDWNCNKSRQNYNTKKKDSGFLSCFSN